MSDLKQMPDLPSNADAVDRKWVSAATGYRAALVSALTMPIIIGDHFKFLRCTPGLVKRVSNAAKWEQHAPIKAIGY